MTKLLKKIHQGLNQKVQGYSIEKISHNISTNSLQIKYIALLLKNRKLHNGLMEADEIRAAHFFSNTLTISYSN